MEDEVYSTPKAAPAATTGRRRKWTRNANRNFAFKQISIHKKTTYISLIRTEWAQNNFKSRLYLQLTLARINFFSRVFFYRCHVIRQIASNLNYSVGRQQLISSLQCLLVRSFTLENIESQCREAKMQSNQTMIYFHFLDKIGFQL